MAESSAPLGKVIPLAGRDDGARGDAEAVAAAAAAAAYVCPSDWPPAGAIDLRTADLPHDSADTEWWYTNGHVTDPDTKHELSFFASFFRIASRGFRPARAMRSASTERLGGWLR